MINENFLLLPSSYLFSEVARRRREFERANPHADIIRMDIGDVTLPVFPVVCDAMHAAVDDMACKEGFHGYAPEQGYEFLRDAIAAYDYQQRGIAIDSDEIFVSDGAKSDLGNLGDIFSSHAVVALADPGYPVYSDSNVMDGRGGDCLPHGRFSHFIYLDSCSDNGFTVPLPDSRPDIIILCSPCNPTGTAMTRSEAATWVNYANANECVIIFDSAYESYVRSKDVVRSIYEIEGAHRCAIEVRSFSKSAGFTGIRCGYTVVPKELMCRDRIGNRYQLHQLWMRRQSTRFNGVGYIVQRAAASLYTPEGQRSIREATDLYLRNATVIRESLGQAGFITYGGTDSPYVWATLHGEKQDSWRLFDSILDKYRISTTPGCGFGRNGEGYVRFTGFNTEELTLRAMERINY